MRARSAIARQARALAYRPSHAPRSEDGRTSRSRRWSGSSSSASSSSSTSSSHSSARGSEATRAPSFSHYRRSWSWASSDSLVSGSPIALGSRPRGIPPCRRFLYPIVIGIVIGLFLSAADVLLHWTATFSTPGGVAFNAPFPGSLLFYPGCAIIVEVFYRLLPIPLLMYLVWHVAYGNFICRC